MESMHWDQNMAQPNDKPRALLPKPWTSYQCRPVPHVMAHFMNAMILLIRQPNLTTSFVTRADIYYDSDADKDLALMTSGPDAPISPATKHLQARYRPLPIQIPGATWQRTIVRELVPRNAQRDRPLQQTCHVFTCTTQTTEHTLVTYLPHVDAAADMPFYHPAVRGLCFIHTFPLDSPAAHTQSDIGESCTVSISLLAYPNNALDTLEPKLSRIASNLLDHTIKLNKSITDGYEKRVHHDLIIPQRRFQDTYAQMKAKYARQLVEDWREETDPAKHVFEDLAIAAFLIELWRDMYGVRPKLDTLDAGVTKDDQLSSTDQGKRDNRSRGFPGFVDIGCGNGLVVHLLIDQGYHGWGFDVRGRKSWAMYPPAARNCLVEGTLVPDVLLTESVVSDDRSGDDRVDDTVLQIPSGSIINGDLSFGTFIISNHADELTNWTPLLAYINRSPFIAIPCCSHDLTGKRARAPGNLRDEQGKRPKTSGTAASKQKNAAPLPQLDEHSGLRRSQAAETGTLYRAPPINSAEDESQSSSYDHSHSAPKEEASQAAHPDSTAANKKAQQPSAYASLMGYVRLLAGAVGYDVRTEMLRIPSTRNACVVGTLSEAQRRSGGNSRRAEVRNGSEKDARMGNAEGLVKGAERVAITPAQADGAAGEVDGQETGVGVDDDEEVARKSRKREVRRLVERETGLDTATVREMWIQRAGLIKSSKGTGH